MDAIQRYLCIRPPTPPPRVTLAYSHPIPAVLQRRLRSVLISGGPKFQHTKTKSNTTRHPYPKTSYASREAFVSGFNIAKSARAISGVVLARSEAQNGLIRNVRSTWQVSWQWLGRHAVVQTSQLYRRR